MTDISRRKLIATGIASAAIPNWAAAGAPRELSWDDLIPPGVPYAEIIGEGAIDIENDLWNPIYDENAKKLNTALEGALIRMPGYMIPLELDARGVTEFILVPYVGACIHVPPPPPNQLVLVDTPEPWPSDQLWDAVWVTGKMRTGFNSFDIADTGYTLTATKMERYEW